MNKYESKYFNTAKKMDEALILLLDKKDFEYITVKDICEKAKVSRSTFYLHYLGLDDLLEEVINEINKSFNDSFKKTKTLDNILDSKIDNDLFLITDDYLIPYLEFIKNNKKVYKAIVKNPNIFSVDKFYKGMFKKVFSPILTKYGVNEDEHEYIMEFFIKGLSAIVISWVSNDCNTDIDKICNIIKKCVRR